MYALLYLITGRTRSTERWRIVRQVRTLVVAAQSLTLSAYVLRLWRTCPLRLLAGSAMPVPGSSSLDLSARHGAHLSFPRQRRDAPQPSLSQPPRAGPQPRALVLAARPPQPRPPSEPPRLLHALPGAPPRPAMRPHPGISLCGDLEAHVLGTGPFLVHDQLARVLRLPEQLDVVVQQRRRLRDAGS